MGNLVLHSIQYRSHSGFPSFKATCVNSASLMVGVLHTGHLERGDSFNSTSSVPPVSPPKSNTPSGHTFTHFWQPVHFSGIKPRTVVVSLSRIDKACVGQTLKQNPHKVQSASFLSAGMFSPAIDSLRAPFS